MDDFRDLYRMGEETREEDALDEKEDCADRGQLSSSSVAGLKTSRTCIPASKYHLKNTANESKNYTNP